mmetsp:Transcript_25041/g.63042  ORF Transcript_25041/g.63042 Transcript_25041/m.63042 type:complete len:213 (+) Transcript_25041:615-1253(+)
MGTLLAVRAIASTSSMLHTSILLYTYRQRTYLRFPSITSISWSTVMSWRSRISQLWILYSCRMRSTIFSSIFSSGTTAVKWMPPVFLTFRYTSGGRWLSRMPTASNSRVRISLCPVLFEASSTISTRSELLAHAMTCPIAQACRRLAHPTRPATLGSPVPLRDGGAHLPPAALARRRALDDSRQIQQLDLGVVVVDDARDARERRELVRRRL